MTAKKNTLTFVAMANPEYPARFLNYGRKPDPHLSIEGSWLQPVLKLSFFPLCYEMIRAVF